MNQKCIGNKDSPKLYLRLDQSFPPAPTDHQSIGLAHQRIAHRYTRSSINNMQSIGANHT